MHILLITNTFPNPLQPTRGTFNYQMVRFLAMDHQVSVISPIAWFLNGILRPHRPMARLAPQQNQSLQIHHPCFYYPPRLLRSYHDQFLWWSVRQSLQAICDRKLPDVVIGYWAHPDGAVALRIARQLGVPAMIMSGGSDVLLWLRSRGHRRRVLRVMREADRLAVVNQHLRQELIANGIAPSRIVVNRRGVDLELFRPGNRLEARRRLGLPANEPAFLCVGRMEKPKGLDVLIDAAALLRDQGVTAHFYLIGGGALEQALKRRTARHRLEGRVSFVGRLPVEKLPDWYRAADATVVPSRSEGVPNVLLESFACQTPAIASRVGGIPEVIDQRLDQLVEPGCPVALSKAIRRRCETLMNPQQGGRVVPRCWRAAARELADYLEELVEPCRNAS